MIETVLLDMDGVIANFVDAALHACRLPVKHDDVTKYNFFEDFALTEGDFWSIVDHTPNFWDNIEPYWELSQIKALIPDAIITTKPSYFEGCASAKLRWLRRFWNPRIDFSGIIMTDLKYKMADDSTLLIDDRDEYVEAFRERGGHAIVYPRPWNSMRDDSDYPFSYLKAELARYGIVSKEVDSGAIHPARKTGCCKAGCGRNRRR